MVSPREMHTGGQRRQQSCSRPAPKQQAVSIEGGVGYRFKA